MADKTTRAGAMPPLALQPTAQAPQTSPKAPGAAPLPNGIITSTQGDGFGTPPAGPMAGGDTITSTEGDGFGTNPAGPITSLPAASFAPKMNPINQAPTAPAPAQGAVNLSPTDPNNALTAQTITPGSMADRFKLAQDRFATFTASSDPAYQAALRDANRMGAAAGGLGSGQLRTSLGDLALNRSRDLTNARDTLFQNALEGTIGDSWNSIGLAERQQAFQNQQQQQAFEQALQQFYAGNAGGTGAATRTAYGSQVAGQGQDALSAFNQWAQNYIPASGGIKSTQKGGPK